MNELSPIIFNIQKFCVHDGPGIRTTVFFKGCPLSCLWCHNPESQAYGRELLYDKEKCTGCRRCEEVCPEQAIQMIGREAVTDRIRCRACGQCAERCLRDARQVAGDNHCGVEEILREIEKDRIFYQQSGGGVTFSGGEALSQIDAVEMLARSCSRRGISVAVDTCGYAPFSVFQRLLPWTDLFLYDIKHMDPELHRRYTGQDNRLILENLRRLVDAGAVVALRLPLIEGINADDNNIGAILAFVAGMPLQKVNLLPYHDIGASKRTRLGLNQPDILLAPPAPERSEEILGRFQRAGFSAEIGG